MTTLRNVHRGGDLAEFVADEAPSWRDYALFALLLVVSSVPVISAHTLPLRDFQAHLARAAIIAAGPDDPFLSQFYQIHILLTGAVGLDLIMPPLISSFGIAWTGKIVVISTFFLITSGAFVLNYTLFRRTTWWLFAPFLLLYNQILTFGFLNYLLALGLFLWVFAGWVRTANWPWLPRLTLFSVLGIVLLTCHLFAFGVYGVCVISVEIAARWRAARDLRVWRGRNSWLALMQFVVPAGFYLATSPNARGLHGAFLFNLKFYGLATLVNTGSIWLDLAISVGCYAMFALALWRRSLSLDRRLAWAVGALVLLFPIMPEVMFGGALAGYRLPVAIVLIAMAATAPSPDANRRFKWPAMAALILLITVQSGMKTLNWLTYDKRYDLIGGLIDQVPVGGRLLVAIPQDDKYYGMNFPPIAYAPQLAIPRRHLLVNGGFVFPADNSSLGLTPPYRWLQTDKAWNAEHYPPDLAAICAAPFTSKASPFRPEVLAEFDYLLVSDRARFGLIAPANFHFVAAEDDFELYRLPQSR